MCEDSGLRGDREEIIESIEPSRSKVVESNES